jgi:hypothetical protein
MSAGNPVTAQALNQRLGQVAVQMRMVMESASDLFKVANGLGSGGLQAAPIGMDSATASDYELKSGYLNTLAGVYYGTVQQGGSGGTGASQFNFDNALSTAWGPQ